MDVYIADFGRGNYAWERCKANPSIATMNDEDAQHFWLAGDREGFIVHIVRTRKTASGNSPPRATASRW